MQSAADTIPALIAEVRSLRDECERLATFKEGYHDAERRLAREIADHELTKPRLNAASKDDLAERLSRRAAHDMTTEKCREETRAILRASAGRIRSDAARIAKYEKVVEIMRWTEGVANHARTGLPSMTGLDVALMDIASHAKRTLAALDEKEAIDDSA